MVLLQIELHLTLSRRFQNGVFRCADGAVIILWVSKHKSQVSRISRHDVQAELFDRVMQEEGRD